MFSDYKGNQQFISQGNLVDNSKAFIFLIGYTNRSRVKIWGTAEVIEDDPELLRQLMSDPKEYRVVPEQVMRFTVEAIDRNCPHHIPQRFEREDVECALSERDSVVAKLEQNVRELKARLNTEAD